MLPSPVLESINHSTPIANLPFNNKRKASRLVSDESPTVKKSCVQLTTEQPSNKGKQKKKCHEFL